MSDEPEPFYSKDLHDHGVLALARVTWERDDAQIALKASKLVAEIAEEGLVRWKREAETARAELEEWRRDYDRGTRMSDLSAEVRSEINHWRERAEIAEAEIPWLQRENSDLNHNIVGMRSSNTNLVAERDDAKAEIARLTKQIEIFKTVDDALEASHQQFRLDNDREWRAKLDHAKAEIARLRSDLSDLEEVHETLRAETKRADYWKAEAEKARAAIKPDTGE